MASSLVELTIEHNGPVRQSEPVRNSGDKIFVVRAWLHLKIDTGSGVGHGNGHAEAIMFEAANELEAELFVETLCYRLQLFFNSLPLEQEVLSTFGFTAQAAAKKLQSEMPNVRVQP